MDSSPHDRFIERFVRSQDRIYAYVATVLPNRTDAEEVFQQTSLVLWQKWRELGPSRDFVRWACGMAHHEVRRDGDSLPWCPRRPWATSNRSPATWRRCLPSRRISTPSCSAGWSSTR